MEEGTEGRERKKMRALTELANWLAIAGDRWRTLVTIPACDRLPIGFLRRRFAIRFLWLVDSNNSLNFHDGVQAKASQMASHG